MLGQEHSDTLTSMNNLAELLRSKGDYEGAEPLQRRAIETCERVLGQEHPDTLTSLNNLALLLESKGDYEGAEPIYNRTLEACEHVFGKEHPNTLTSVSKLALLLKNKGDYEGAEPLYCRALDGICKASCNMGGAHPHLKTMIYNYMDCLQMMGMNEVQVRQRIEAVLKPYGFNP